MNTQQQKPLSLFVVAVVCIQNLTPHILKHELSHELGHKQLKTIIGKYTFSRFPAACYA